MSERLLTGNIINRPTGVTVISEVTGRYTHIIAVADVTTTIQTVLPLKVRSGQPGRDDITIPLIPVGAQIIHLGMRIPAGLIATNGNALKLAHGVDSTGTQAFDAVGLTAYVRSAVAASGTFAAAAVSFPGTQNAAVAGAVLTAPLNFRIFSDNNGAAAGAGVSVASGTAQIVAQIVYWEPLEVPRLEAIAGRPARG